MATTRLSNVDGQEVPALERGVRSGHVSREHQDRRDHPRGLPDRDLRRRQPAVALDHAPDRLLQEPAATALVESGPCPRRGAAGALADGAHPGGPCRARARLAAAGARVDPRLLSLIHISEPTRRTPISYAVFCLK